MYPTCFTSHEVTLAPACLSARPGYSIVRHSVLAPRNKCRYTVVYSSHIHSSKEVCSNEHVDYPHKKKSLLLC